MFNFKKNLLRVIGILFIICISIATWFYLPVFLGVELNSLKKTILTILPASLFSTIFQLVDLHSKLRDSVLKKKELEQILYNQQQLEISKYGWLIEFEEFIHNELKKPLILAEKMSTNELHYLYRDIHKENGEWKITQSSFKEVRFLRNHLFESYSYINEQLPKISMSTQKKVHEYINEVLNIYSSTLERIGRSHESDQVQLEQLRDKIRWKWIILEVAFQTEIDNHYKKMNNIKK